MAKPQRSVEELQAELRTLVEIHEYTQRVSHYSEVLAHLTYRKSQTRRKIDAAKRKRVREEREGVRGVD